MKKNPEGAPRKNPENPLNAPNREAELLHRMNEATTTITARLPFSLKVALMNEAVDHSMNASQWLTYLVANRGKFQDEINRLNEEVDSLRKEQTKERAVKAKEIADLKAEIKATDERYHKALADLVREEKKLTEAIKTTTSKLSSTEGQVTQKVIHITELTHSLNLSQSKADDLTRKVTELTQSLNITQSKNDELTLRVTELTHSLNDFQAKAKNLQVRIDKANALPDLRYGGKGLLDDPIPCKV